MSLNSKTAYQQFFMAIYHLPSGYGCSRQHLTVHKQQQNQIFSSQVNKISTI
jgi:DNA repair ATPase RecN